jgi:hypothetical protein
LKSQEISKKVVGLTVSEFGRRPYQNESSGCDHGASGAMFVFGDAINGAVHGGNFNFDNLDKNGDFKYAIDFRSVYDEVLSNWFGADDTSIKGIFGSRFAKVGSGLFTKASYVVLGSEPTFITTAGPNPTHNGWIELKVKINAGEKLLVEQTDALGRSNILIPHVPLPAGVHKLPVQLRGGKGMYLLKVMHGKEHATLKVIYS